MLPVSPFPGCCSVSSARLDKWPLRPLASPRRFRPLLPNSSGSRLVLRCFSYRAQPQLASGLHFGSPGRLSAVNTARIGWIQSAGRASERFRPHFPFSTRLPGDRKRIATNHSLSTTTQAARSRARVPLVRWIDSAFLQRSMLICSLLLLFVRGNRHLRKRYRLPVRILRNNEISFHDSHLGYKRKDIRKQYTEKNW